VDETLILRLRYKEEKIEFPINKIDKVEGFKNSVIGFEEVMVNYLNNLSSVEEDIKSFYILEFDFKKFQIFIEETKKDIEQLSQSLGELKKGDVNEKNLLNYQKFFQN
jgi:hypothetical protein